MSPFATTKPCSLEKTSQRGSRPMILNFPYCPPTEPFPDLLLQPYLPPAACPKILMPHTQTVHLFKYYVFICTPFTKRVTCCYHPGINSQPCECHRLIRIERMPWTEGAMGTGRWGGARHRKRALSAGLRPWKYLQTPHMGLSQSNRRVTVHSST